MFWFWYELPFLRSHSDDLDLTRCSGTLILVPLYLKFGRRPVLLASMIIFLAGLIGASQATTFAGLMTARCFHAFGSGVCEALPVQIVNDIFFLHERGSRIGYYTGKNIWDITDLALTMP